MKMVGNDWENSPNGPNSSKSLPNCLKMSPNVPKCPLQTHRCLNGIVTVFVVCLAEGKMLTHFSLLFHQSFLTHQALRGHMRVHGGPVNSLPPLPVSLTNKELESQVQITVRTSVVVEFLRSWQNYDINMMTTLTSLTFNFDFSHTGFELFFTVKW